MRRALLLAIFIAFVSRAVWAQADLSLSWSGFPHIAPGGETILNLLIRNAGPATAQKVVMIDSLPEGTTFVEVRNEFGDVGPFPPGFDCVGPAVGTNGTVRCSLETLGPNEARFMHFALKAENIAAGATFTNTAIVTSDTPDPNLANNRSSFTLTANAVDLALTMTAPSSMPVGSQVVYDITVTSRGNLNAPDVDLTVSPQRYFTFQSLSAPSNWTCTTPMVGRPGHVRCGIPSLASGASATFRLITTLEADSPIGIRAESWAGVRTSSLEPGGRNNARLLVTATTASIPALGVHSLVALVVALAVAGAIAARH